MKLCYAMRRGVYYPSQRDAFESELAAYAGRRLHKDLGGQVRVLEAWRQA